VQEVSLAGHDVRRREGRRHVAHDLDQIELLVGALLGQILRYELGRELPGSSSSV
jgi:hypothetical protein